MDPPGIARAISCDSSQALRLHAYIRPVRWRLCWPPGLDGFRALPPPHLNDLLAVRAISRVWKSRSDLLCHAYVTTHAIVWRSYWIPGSYVTSNSMTENSTLLDVP